MAFVAIGPGWEPDPALKVDEVWAAMRPGDVTIRLGVTAAKVEALGLTEDRAFVDLAQLDSFTLSGRPFAMVGRSAQS